MEQSGLTKVCDPFYMKHARSLPDRGFHHSQGAHGFANSGFGSSADERFSLTDRAVAVLEEMRGRSADHESAGPGAS